MSKTIAQERFTQELFAILDETFETHHGIFLDKDTSLFDTLATINAAAASLPVGGKCATLAAQVAHVTFYLGVLEDTILKKDTGPVDWGAVWREVAAVSPEEWAALQQELQHTYRRVCASLQALERWDDETSIGGALAIVVHSAYHLGEIRQALCTLK
jgi:hypothetical protein